MELDYPCTKKWSERYEKFSKRHCSKNHLSDSFTRHDHVHVWVQEKQGVNLEVFQFGPAALIISTFGIQPRRWHTRYRNTIELPGKLLHVGVQRSCTARSVPPEQGPDQEVARLLRLVMNFILYLGLLLGVEIRLGWAFGSRATLDDGLQGTENLLVGGSRFGQRVEKPKQNRNLKQI